MRKKQIPIQYHLNDVIGKIQGPTKEQIIVFNQWAAVALNNYHTNSNTEFEFLLDGKQTKVILQWDSNFSQDAMKERKNIAEFGGVSLAIFVMSVLSDYKYLHQSEIGEGVDYGFQKSRPGSDNFLENTHYIEVSGLLEEKSNNTLSNRIGIKHAQIEKGIRKNDPASVIVTLFKNPITVKETHK